MIAVDSSAAPSLNVTMTPRRTQPRGQHGGTREGAGRKSVFKEKALDKPFAMDFTAHGQKVLAALVKRTGLSRNAVIATLALQFADKLAFDPDDPAPFSPKAQAVLSIRVPPKAGGKLAAARVRTGRSYSDIGEALVTWFADRTTFPAPTSRKS